MVRVKLYFLVLMTMFFFQKNATANYEKLFYDFKIKDISGNYLNLNEYKNKVVLLVNTASYCGFTKQYDDFPNTINPLFLYLVHRFCKSSYCFVKPQ